MHISDASRFKTDLEARLRGNVAKLLTEEDFNDVNNAVFGSNDCWLCSIAGKLNEKVSNLYKEFDDVSYWKPQDLGTIVDLYKTIAQARPQASILSNIGEMASFSDPISFQNHLSNNIVNGKVKEYIVAFKIQRPDTALEGHVLNLKVGKDDNQIVKLFTDFQQLPYDSKRYSTNLPLGVKSIWLLGPLNEQNINLLSTEDWSRILNKLSYTTIIQ